MAENKLYIISGPTASGKTSLALKIAKRQNRAIISADSRQIYKHLDIGTAKPFPKELESVKHHLVGFLSPNEQYNAGRFLDDSQLIVFQYVQENKPLPLIVGGTGLYIKAFTDGLAEIPDIPGHIIEELKRISKARGLDALYDQLAQIDPEAAESVHSNDKQRIIRFLSVYLYTRKTYTSFLRKQEKPQYPFKIQKIILFPPRDDLYDKIDERVISMFESGFVKEVKKLLEQGYSPHCPGFSSLGYQEIISYLKNETTLEETIETIKRKTRQFAKRQYTWFKKEENAIFIESEEELLETEARILHEST